MTDEYVPEAGHVVWTDFDPRTGREQGGRRPALVVSPAPFWIASRLAIVCPITSQIKDFPTLVSLPDGILPKPSAVMVDQVRAVDWRARGGTPAACCPAAVTAEVLRKLTVLIAS